jgi:hypothetical protein
MQFGDVIGQDHIKQKLIEEVNEGRFLMRYFYVVMKGLENFHWR